MSQPATDNQICSFALKNNFIEITNDSDFIDLINLLNFPPKVILLKNKNQSSNYILDLVVAKISEINLLEKFTEYGLIELF